ncbi:hypothetical protein N0V83_008941 [Neocucurbitaria cava]|uniref:Uncharacterized protein n=1 Tax=Neocucurbitaria cava TaxID=798079 RepID=A0A9W8Y1N2_9PLEO|nr:hypothetical protein N0V83_008941 [Neocucurbitaria cava]
MFEGKDITAPERVRELTRNLGNLCAGKDQLFRLKLCILADRLVADVFAHAANHCFVDHVLREQHVDYAVVIHAWKPWLPPNHPIMDFLVDAQCATGRRDKDTAANGRLALREQLPNGFLLKVMDRGPIINTDQRSLLYRCDYHDHVSEQERKDCEARRRGRETKLEAQYWTYEPDY